MPRSRRNCSAKGSGTDNCTTWSGTTYPNARQVDAWFDDTAPLDGILGRPTALHDSGLGDSVATKGARLKTIDILIGGFSFVPSNIVISMDDPNACGCRKCKYSFELLIMDTAGIEEKEALNLTTKGIRCIAPARIVQRARWVISGDGTCCTKKEKM